MNNIQETIRDWIEKRVSEDYSGLASIQLATTGEQSDVTPAFIGIFETGATVHESGGVTMYGVTDFEIAVELHTVPADESNEGTPIATEQEWRRNLYDILADRDLITWGSDRNGWRLFDIRTAAPITESGEGQRITRYELLVVACPI